MWRGVARARPIRTGASFVGLGTHRHRVVFYPISQPDPKTGLADINWVAEITIDNANGWTQGDWNRKVRHEDFMHHFDQWNYDWIDIPGMLRGATEVYEYPMIDRDPISTWRDGNTALLGDAAHVMYPTGSNGASQAIVDARILGATILEHGVNSHALRAYDEKLRPEISPLILRNRAAGPFGLLNLLDDRCGGVFDDIEAVIPRAEREEFMRGYKMAAGFAAEKLNTSPPIIPPSARYAPAKVG
jgi:2-polyprenyl-6-methoxyphenol hydroxylase-like FAD-dependent oxidoreductase